MRQGQPKAEVPEPGLEPGWHPLGHLLPLPLLPPGIREKCPHICKELLGSVLEHE